MLKDKRGDLSISFGMIFAIILIVALLGVAFYAIRYFLNLSECSEISLFYNDFQDEVDRAWRSEITRDVFAGSLPDGIESVCIGDLNSANGISELDKLRRYRSQDANVFLYPPEKACNEGFNKIEHISIEGFKCFKVDSGRVKITIEKESSDNLVKIK